MAALDAQIGNRIKRLRRQRNISQAQLAGALSISPSYLNLIEHNRRRVTVPLLLRTASFFGVEAGALAETDSSRLAGDLMEVFGDDDFADSNLTNQDVHDLASSNPALGWAVVRLFDRYRRLKRSHGSDAASGTEEYYAAADAVSDFIQANGNHFPTLEAAAERVRADIDRASDAFDYGLRTYLANVFGLQWRLGSLPGDLVRRLDVERGELVTAEVLPMESAVFAVAQQVGLLAAAAAIDRLIEESGLLGDAPVLARNALASYFAGALVMPYEPFHRACRDTRYDIERVGRRFKASFEQVCHRMTTLQRPGLSGLPLHLVRTDIAGNISKRFSMSGIHIPRHSGACPRWNVYGAFLQPERLNVQLSQMPDGALYVCIAKSVAKGGYRYNAPRRHLSIGLGCHASRAGEMIYSDGIDLRNPDLAVPIGVGCRICPRSDCGQRAHPPADHRSACDPVARSGNVHART